MIGAESASPNMTNSKGKIIPMFYRAPEADAEIMRFSIALMQLLQHARMLSQYKANAYYPKS